MIKKYLVYIICIMCVLTLSVSVFAQPDTNTTADETAQEQMPMQGGMGGRMGGRPGGMGGQMPENMTPPENGEGMQRPDDAPAMAENPQGDEQTATPREGDVSNGTEMQMPDKSNRGNMMPYNGSFGNENQNAITENEQNSRSIINFVKEYQTPVISVVLLLLAFVFVKFYKRKNY